MPRPKKVVKSVTKNLCLPEPLVARVDLILFSELEGRVPFAAWQGFVVEAIEEKLLRMSGELAEAPAGMHDRKIADLAGKGVESAFEEIHGFIK